MKAWEAVKKMVELDGRNVSTISSAIGRPISYISGITYRKKDVTTSTLATIAHECGWELVLVPDGDAPSSAISIDARE